jgi:hypothetical protein
MMHPQSEKRVKDLSEDRIFLDLMVFAKAHIATATHDALLRFRWAEYAYNEGVAAISFVLCNLLATVNRQIEITPDQIGLMVKEALIDARKEDEDDD